MSESIVYNGDCLAAMREMPDNAFELAVCDVPYGIGVGKMAFLQERGTSVKQKNGTRLNHHKSKAGYAKKDWDSLPPSQEYFDELRRISLHQIIFGIEYCPWEGVGTGRIKWDKGMAEGVSFKRYEVAYCSLIEHTVIIPLLWAGMCQAKSLAEPMTQQGNKKLNEKRIHPCQKPVLLYQRILTDFAQPGWRIISTHVGSGSDRIAADQLGFHFVGYETDLEHYEAQEKRFQQSKMQLSIF